MKNDRLTIAGREIRDSLGRSVLLRGANTGGRSKWEPFMPFDFTDEPSFAAGLERVMNALTGIGANVIRAPFSWEALEPKRGAFDKVYLERYARLIDAAWARGIRTVVDFHQDVFATVFSGDGFPLWALGSIEHGPPRRDMPDGDWFPQYFAQGGPVPRAFDRFWKNEDGLLDAFESMWSRVAKRLGAHPGVLGFEIMNEPGWGSMDMGAFERVTLPALWQRIGLAIHEQAKGAVIVGGGPGTDGLMGSTQLRKPEIAPFLYAPHFYEVAVATGGVYPGIAAIEQRVKTLAAVGEQWNCPVLFGEFGASDHSDGRVQYLRDVYSLYDALKVHTTIWEISFSKELWNNEALGLIGPDLVERATYAEADRAYPRAVSGRLHAFSWTPEQARFQLEVHEAGQHDTECYLPQRWLGAEPKVAIEGDATASWDAKTSVLQIRGSREYIATVTK